MLDEPEERLAYAAKFSHLVKDKRDCFLHTPVRVLLKSVAHLHEADRRGHDEFTTSSLLVARRERTLAQQVEFVLVETALQAEQEAIIALSRGINCLLVNQHRVDDAVLIDQEAIYAPRQGNDRLLLGLKGSLNEYELDLLRQRSLS